MKFLLLFYPNNIFIAKFPNVYLIKLINFSNIFKKSGGAEPSLGGARPTLGGEGGLGGWGGGWGQVLPPTIPNDVPQHDVWQFYCCPGGKQLLCSG